MGVNLGTLRVIGFGRFWHWFWRCGIGFGGVQFENLLKTNATAALDHAGWTIAGASCAGTATVPVHPTLECCADPPKCTQWIGDPKFSRAHEQAASFSAATWPAPPAPSSSTFSPRTSMPKSSRKLCVMPSASVLKPWLRN